MKNYIINKQKYIACMLCLALLLEMIPAVGLAAAYAKELSVENADLQEDAAISLDYVSSVTLDQEDRVVRIYGNPEKIYNNAISVTANCTVILDHVNNEADLTVADGKEARIVLRGNNQLANICATGGSATLVHILGETEGGTLNANDIACSKGGTTQTGARLYIENSVIFCKNLGCGGNGADVYYVDGSANIAAATPGSNASPNIIIEGSKLSVSGSMACGGNGVLSKGTWSAKASAGGSSGEVTICSSRVTVGGSLAIGGLGGGGVLGSNYYNCKAGNTASSSPVTITDHSIVEVTGNVATQQNLPDKSDDGRQNGLHGVTVTVTDSSLSANDIASGGAGHTQIRYNVFTGAGTSYNICGTAGGNGGILIADNAVITCNRAVCGANAGDYQNYTVSMYGDTSGDPEYKNHPLDGKGGMIRATDSFLKITGVAAAKGTKWDSRPNPSTYSDSTYIGGTLDGKLYGNIITTDVTSIIGGDFISSDIRNSEESTCVKCTLKTDAALAGKTVSVRANSLGGNVMLGNDGNMTTYLSIGKEAVKLTGAGVYSGTFMVKRSAALNVFQLEPYGVINVTFDGAVIKNNSYVHTNETYDYDGDFIVRGSSEDTAVSIQEGTKQITLEDTSFDTLNVNGTSVVTLMLSGESHIRAVHVEEHATLIIEGDGKLITEHLGNGNGSSGKIEINSGTVEAKMLGGSEGSKEVTIKNPSAVEIGESRVPLFDEYGNPLYPIELVLGNEGAYALRFNSTLETIVLTDGKTSVRKLLPAGTYALEVTKELFCFRGSVTIREAQRIYLDDLTLYVDTSMGDIYIRDGEVVVGETAIVTDAEVRITQSGDKSNAVHVNKKTASIILDGVSPDVQIYLPEDFEGIICDADNRPIQVVTVRTGFQTKEMQLHLDGQAYTLTTNAQGNISILTGRGMHTFGLTIDGISYRCKDTVSISSTENIVRFSDMALVWNVKDGDFSITQEGFLAGKISGDYAGAYLMVQGMSDSENGTVTVDGDADIFLSKEVDELLQVKVSDGFKGSILKENVPCYPLVVATNCTESAVKVNLDGHEGVLRTDREGKLSFVAEAGVHVLTVATDEVTAMFAVSVGKNGAEVFFDDLLGLIISGLTENGSVTVKTGDVIAQVETDDTGSCQILVDASIKEVIITDGEKSYRYPVVNGQLGEREPYVPKNPDLDNSGGNNEKTEGSSGGIGGAGNSGGSGSSGNFGDGKGNAKSPGSKNEVSDKLGGEGNKLPGGSLSGRLQIDRLKGAHRMYTDHAAVFAKKPSIRITCSLKGVKLVSTKEKNTYKAYSKKKVCITLAREKNTEYYYKIVGKGHHKSTMAWKKLKGNRITVKPAAYGQRVFIKAKNSGGTTIKKTTGFVVDAAKPTVTGVKNARIYKGARIVAVSDKGGIANVRLNGKKMPTQFLVQKKGVYRLVVTDCAGNKKQVFFAVI